VSKIDHYRQILGTIQDWQAYLLAESGLPGPRGNLELARAVAQEGTRDFFQGCLAYTPDIAPTGTQEEFLAFCGVVGLGKLLAEGDRSTLPQLRQAANDPRWRIREGVAMALQIYGEADMEGLIEEMAIWQEGSLYERRACVAGLCEPVLLKNEAHIRSVLDILDSVTASLERSNERKSAEFIALRKGLAYCWSVAVVALPDEGKRRMERWLQSADHDIRWIMRENLKKNRLVRLDPQWVSTWLEFTSK
jgi:hypothetical protein